MNSILFWSIKAVHTVGIITLSFGAMRSKSGTSLTTKMSGKLKRAMLKRRMEEVKVGQMHIC